MSIRGKPDVDDFIAEPDAPKDDGISVMIRAPHPTVQRNYRLPWEVAAQLKAEVARRSHEEGRRVTENELVVAWLRKALK